MIERISKMLEEEHELITFLINEQTSCVQNSPGYTGFFLWKSDLAHIFARLHPLLASSIGEINRLGNSCTQKLNIFLNFKDCFMYQNLDCSCSGPYQGRGGPAKADMSGVWRRCQRLSLRRLVLRGLQGLLQEDNPGWELTVNNF